MSLYCSREHSGGLVCALYVLALIGAILVWPFVLARDWLRH